MQLSRTGPQRQITGFNRHEVFKGFVGLLYDQVGRLLARAIFDFAQHERFVHVVDQPSVAPFADGQIIKQFSGFVCFGTQLVIDRIEFFVAGLKLLVACLQFLVAGLKLLVGRLQFFVKRLQFFCACLKLLDGVLKILTGNAQLLLQFMDTFMAGVFERCSSLHS